MTIDRDSAPHIAPAERLARGEPPAEGTPVSAGIPGRGKAHLVGRLVLYAVLVGIAIFYLWPFYWTISTSFKTLPDSVKGLQLVPHHLTLKGYREAFTTGPFGRYFLNSAIFAITVTISNLFLCALGGCAWTIGRDVPGFTTNDYGKNNQYGPLLSLAYIDVGGGVVNRFNDFRKIIKNPCIR
jgi:hypothetical protein